VLLDEGRDVGQLGDRLVVDGQHPIANVHRAVGRHPRAHLDDGDLRRIGLDRVAESRERDILRHILGLLHQPRVDLEVVLVGQASDRVAPLDHVAVGVEPARDDAPDARVVVGDAHGEEQHVAPVAVGLRAVDGDHVLVERGREPGRDDHVGKVDEEAGNQHHHDEHAQRRQSPGEPGVGAPARRWFVAPGVVRVRDVARAGRVRCALVHRAPNRYRGGIARSPDAQPATPPTFFGTRPRPNLALRTARRGWALVRTAVLVFLTGLLVALVLATLFGALVIAINGKLP
jgi:hypothetical protein